MPQKINLHNSFTLYRFLLAFFFGQSFINFAVFVRNLVLLFLVGFKFLSGGIQSFIEPVYFGLFAAGSVFSLLRLVPIKFGAFILDNWLRVYLIWVFKHNAEITRHAAYAYIIFNWSIVDGFNFIYHYYKLKTLNRKVPSWISTFHRYLTLVDFPILAILEFILLFLNLKNNKNLFNQIVLLFFIPTKFYLLKRLFFKYYFGTEDKHQHVD